MRARHIDKIEALADATLGLVINYWAVMYIMHNVLEIPITYGQNGVVSVILFCLAILRKYTIRRWFSNWIKRLYKE